MVDRVVRLMQLRAAMITVALMVAAVPGTGQSAGPAAAGYESPEAAYTAMAAGLSEGEWSAAISAITDEGVARLNIALLRTAAWGLVMAAEDKESLLSLAEGEYGLDVATTTDSGSPIRIARGRELAVDLYQWIASHQPREREVMPLAGDRLVELAARSDAEASGTVESDGPDGLERFPVDFMRTKSGWLIGPRIGLGVDKWSGDI